MIYLLLAASLAHAVIENKIAPEFVGSWATSQNECAHPVLTAKRDSLVVHHKQFKRRYGTFEVCYSCAGGARSTKTEVYYSPVRASYKAPKDGIADLEHTDFLLRFNYEEKKDVVRLEEPKVNLPEMTLIKCK